MRTISALVQEVKKSTKNCKLELILMWLVRMNTAKLSLCTIKSAGIHVIWFRTQNKCVTTGAIFLSGFAF